MKKTEESVMEFRLQLNSQSYDYTFIVLLPESFVKLLSTATVILFDMDSFNLIYLKKKQLIIYGIKSAHR